MPTKLDKLLTKRQRLRKYTEALLFSLGLYRNYGSFEPTKVKRFVFVCAGNICRSAVAESYAKSIGLPAASFGINCPDGDPANQEMQKIAAKHGLDLEDHLTTSVENFQPKLGDLIIAMEKQHIDKIKKSLENQESYDHILLGLYASIRRPTIIDPYGRHETVFEQTFIDIKEAIKNLSNHTDVLKNQEG